MRNKLKKPKKLKKYLVQTRETVFTDYFVMAKNADEAEEMVQMGNVPIPEPTDSCDFEILDGTEEVK